MLAVHPKQLATALQISSTATGTQLSAVSGASSEQFPAHTKASLSTNKPNRAALNALATFSAAPCRQFAQIDCHPRSQSLLNETLLRFVVT